MAAGERFIRLPPTISAFSPSAAPLAEAIGVLLPTTLGSARSLLALEYTSMVGALNIRSRHIAGLPTFARRCRLKFTQVLASRKQGASRRPHGAQRARCGYMAFPDS
jgi:hypothetical protein